MGYGVCHYGAENEKGLKVRKRAAEMGLHSSGDREALGGRSGWTLGGQEFATAQLVKV